MHNKKKEKQADSIHLIGVKEYQACNYDLAVKKIKEAISLNPTNPFYYNNLGIVLNAQGNTSIAIESFLKALRIKPNLHDSYYNLGISYSILKDFDKAIESYQKSIQINPKDIRVYNNLGIAYKLSGKLKEAIYCYEKAIEIKPDYIEALNNIGNALRECGRLDEALIHYQKIINIKSDSALVYNNIGNVYREKGDIKEGLLFYEKAIKYNPDFAEAYNNKGVILTEIGKNNEAIEYFKKAISCRSDYPEAYTNLGTVYKEIGNLGEALSLYKKAINLKSDFIEAYYNIGAINAANDNPEEAISWYRKAIDLRPSYGKAVFSLYHQLQHICAWDEMKDLEIKIDKFQNYDEEPFIHLARKPDAASNFNVAKSWSKAISNKVKSLKIPFNFQKRPKKDKINIGYLSNDFRNHAVGHLVIPLFKNHNRNHFKIFCYSSGVDDKSHFRESISKSCDKFVDIRTLDNIEAAKCIYNDNIDILVDMMGYTTGTRSSISAFRPAPIQVSYLGFLGTTGSDFIDYIICDKIVTPEDHAKFYSEKFVYMPHSYQINNEYQEIAELDLKKEDFGLRKDSFVFCSFNQTYKIDSQIFDVWMKILREVEGSVLWLVKNIFAEANLKKEAKKRGISEERIIFAEKLPLDKHLYRLKFADIALDTKIYNGGATTSNALWASVPVITIQGDHFPSRMTASALNAMGLTDLIAYSLDEYEKKAIFFAKNPLELAKLKDRLEHNKKTEPFFNSERFVKDLENAYHGMIAGAN
ncbi:MAG: tetratricopeptide repeat protein [Desulfobacterales bacterium]|nr:tetratricopeptide repeat protein [Desulfobacterales bacterium]